MGVQFVAVLVVVEFVVVLGVVGSAEGVTGCDAAAALLL